MIRLNLYRKESGEAPRRSRVVAVAIATVLIGASAWRYELGHRLEVARARLAAAQEHVAELRRELASPVTPLDDDADDDVRGPLPLDFRLSGWACQLRSIAGAVPPGIVLDQIIFDGRQVRLFGWAHVTAALSPLVAALAESSPRWSDATIEFQPGTQTSATRAPRQRFTIAAAWGG